LTPGTRSVGLYRHPQDIAMPIDSFRTVTQRREVASLHRLFKRRL